MLNWGDGEDDLRDFDDLEDLEEGAKKLAIDNYLHLEPKAMSQIQDSIETLPEQHALGGKS